MRRLRLLLAFCALLPFVGPREARGQDAQTPQLQFTQHAQARMKERGISAPQISRIIESGEKFKYYHANKWKTGFYDPKEKIFIATDGKTVITVFPNASRAYVEKLKRKKP